MMRFTLLAVVVFVAAALAMPQSGPGAVPKAAPTPVGLQYDEIARMAVPPATPPPPGSFGADYAKLMNPAQSASEDEDPAAAAIAKAMGGKMPPGMNFMQGKLTRYAFYKGWVRTDDVLAKTAEIRKCDVHQFIALDLAKKTYHLSDRSADDMNAGQEAAPGAQTGPGTAVFTVSRKGASLGPMTLEGVATNGYRSVSSMNITKATGSCQQGTFSSIQTEYVSGIREPHAFCPLNRNAMGMPETGGCKPTMKAQSSGAIAPAGKLVMYAKTAMLPAGSTDENASGSAFVTQRGNVKVLYLTDAAPLFSIPADFTKI